MNLFARETAIYTIGAAAAFSVDICTLWVLVRFLGMHYLAAAAVGFLAGTVVIYLISVRHAFSFRRIADYRTEFGVFTVVGIVGILLNLGIMYLMVETLHVHYLAAKVVASGLTFVTNFGLRRVLLFTPWRARCTAGESGSKK